MPSYDKFLPEINQYILTHHPQILNVIGKMEKTISELFYTLQFKLLLLPPNCTALIERTDDNKFSWGHVVFTMYDKEKKIPFTFYIVLSIRFSTPVVTFNYENFNLSELKWVEVAGNNHFYLHKAILNDMAKNLRMKGIIEQLGIIPLQCVVDVVYKHVHENLGPKLINL